MNDVGFKVAGHLRHKGATPSPPTGNVCKHPKQHSNLMDTVPAMCFLGTDTANNKRLPYEKAKFEFRMQ